jgi:hypothetical protein
MEAAAAIDAYNSPSAGYATGAEIRSYSLPSSFFHYSKFRPDIGEWRVVEIKK